jgi:cytochrome c-type biogenesis protein CcmE
MTPKRKQRLMVVFLIILGVGATVALAVTAFQQNMLFFFSPTQIAAGEAPKNRQIRIGGMVSKGSVQRVTSSLQVNFEVTDFAHTVKISYEGILPDLFREGQGVIAIGDMQADGTFSAKEVLAKHDEKYMPPEVAQIMKAKENATNAPTNPVKN